MIYIKNMYITCVVIDHRKNLTIQQLDYVEEYQIYLNKQNVGKKNETGQITSENIKLSKQPKR